MTRRTDKIARTLQVHLAELVNYHLADPRVEGLVTVTAVDISPDMHYADVGLTVFGADEARQRNVVRAVQHAAGKLQRMLGQRVDMKHIPRLRFHLDEHTIRVRRTLDAIDEAMRHTRPPAGPPDSPTETEPS